MIIQPTGDIREYYVVFTDHARLGWLPGLFTRKGFRHVEVFAPLGKEACIAITHTLENADITLYNMPVKTAIRHLKARGCTVVYIPTIIQPRKIKFGLFIPSCVSTAQIITGLSFHAFTPYGYYKALLNHGVIVE